MVANSGPPTVVADRIGMNDLSLPKAPFTIELPYGIVATVRLLTTAGMATAQAAARRAVEAISGRRANGRTPAFQQMACRI
jgi:hypothetical protein